MTDTSTSEPALGPLKRLVASVTDRRARPLPTLPTKETLPTLPTLDEHGNVIADPARGAGAPPTVDAGAIEAVRAFLYREARLLDDRRWEEWLGLWEADARYRMPTRRTVLPTGDPQPIAGELADDDSVWWFDETRAQISMRIEKLNTGKAWAEEPPSRTRRYVSNVEWDPATGTARSNVLIYRGRRDNDVEWFSCGRTDQLILRSGEFRLAGREVVIDENVVAGDNLILFF